MRFDDMVATVLAQPRNTLAARIAIWRQLVDLLGQRGGESETGQSDATYDLLESWRHEMPVAVRAESAQALAGRSLPQRLVVFFAQDRPDIAAPVIMRARLDAADWIAALSAMRPSTRSLLRHRRDLDPPVVEALARYGAADMILETSVEAEHGAQADRGEVELDAAGHAQIRNLVERIEAFRRDRVTPVAASPAEPVTEIVSEFRFEAGPDGVINWVDGAPRGPLVGQTIAFSADALDCGVDGHAAGAFRQRAPFRDARLVVAGQGAASGAWRISAVPFFTDSDGRFAGYRGMARRPRRDEDAAIDAPQGQGLFGSSLEPDSLRQLIHELRTPLNAIAGFAEMIERQLLGPVSASYRDRASTITGEAANLLRAVDDLDAAARSEAGQNALAPQSVDGAGILERLHDEYAGQADARGVKVAISIDENLPLLAADPIAAERMIERLLAAAVGLAGPGETIAIRCVPERGGASVAMSFARPALLIGKSESELLDPGYSPDGDWPDAPALGLGFALRLVGNIAREAEGSLTIETENFVLRLPAKDASACSSGRG